MNDKFEDFCDLLRGQYGLEIEDVDERAVRRMIVDGEEPQEIVDQLAEKYNLTKIE